uniref:phenylalanine--tRNA ligase n=1 Tax=Arcella intermedia TaxID=1963864 RepID=A0A6B2L333_9EUKA
MAAKEIAVMAQGEKAAVVLTEDGEGIVREGSPEFVLWRALPAEGRRGREEVAGEIGEGVLAIAVNQAARVGWVRVEKEGDKKAPVVFLSRKVLEVEDSTRAVLEKVKRGEVLEEAQVNEFKRRKLVQLLKETVWTISKGPRFSFDWKIKYDSDITRDMIIKGTWKDAHLKPLNLDALGVPPDGGHLHPLLKVRKEFREIFLELGYEEMPTNNFVESSFWNFDALFQPQFHPVRDAHDTFFIADPAETLILPEDYLARVKKMHEEGGYGSVGWRYKWQDAESKKNILRTHTTAISSRMLYKLAQNPIFTPKKYFSIDRVYRNETTDQTHLAEFHQIEGLVADYNLTLAHLIGAIKQFFQRYGIRNLKFKPAYNPYTEPSMEVFGYHPELGKWVEIGNSGMFRPEMLAPMGLPPNVRVIAWGLSLERPTMIKYHIKNISKLLGHKVDIDSIKTNPICRFEK